MRRTKRFLHGPLLHLVNFYSLVDCQALGSTNTFHATPWSRIKKTDGKKDCWWIQLSAFKGSVCFLDCVFVCEADDYVPPQIDAFIMKPHTGPAHGLFCQPQTCLHSCVSEALTPQLKQRYCSSLLGILLITAWLQTVNSTQFPNTHTT